MITSLEMPKRAIGNAMFNMAVLLAVSIRTGFEPVFPRGDEYIHHSGQKIQLLYNGFDLSVGLLDSRDIKINNIYHETGDNIFSENIFHIGDHTSLEGYFQDLRYFDNYKKQIKSHFKFKNEILYKSLRIFKEKSIKPQDCVAVHIRRGDFLKLSNHHPPLPMDFYHKALNRNEIIEGRPIFFSDDYEWCVENFPENLIINNDDAFMDLCMMALCGANVIANSTFSWWAAYISDSNHDKVIYPRNWFGPAKGYTPNIFPEKWISL